VFFLSVFVSFLFDFLLGGGILPFVTLYEFRLNRFDPSIVSRSSLRSFESGRKIEHDQEDPRLQCFFFFLGDRWEFLEHPVMKRAIHSKV